MSITNEEYFFQNQIRIMTTQFCNIFNNIRIRIDNDKFVAMKSMYAPGDRTAAAILNNGTSNEMIQVPAFSSYLSAIEYETSRAVGHNTIIRQKVAKATGVGSRPEKLQGSYTARAHPITLKFESVLFVSSEEEFFEIIEQLWLIFGGNVLDIQTSNAVLDNTLINNVLLDSLTRSDHLPLEDKQRILQWNLNFTVRGWIAYPVTYKDNIIGRIKANIGTLNELVTFDKTGNVIPFMNADGTDGDIIFPKFSDIIIEDSNDED